MRHVVYDISDAVTYACWGAFALVWIAGAVWGRLRAPATRRRESRDIASLVAGAVALVAIETPHSLWQPITAGASGIRLAGVVVLIPATIFTIAARVSLGAMWSSAPIVREHHVLHTDGLYRLTRHPIYSGILAMLVGTTLAQGFGRCVAVLAGVLVMLIVKIRSEEHLLSEEFGTEYARYRRRVAALVPRLPTRRGRAT